MPARAAAAAGTRGRQGGPTCALGPRLTFATCGPVRFALDGKIDPRRRNPSQQRPAGRPAGRRPRPPRGDDPMTRTKPPFRADHVGSILRSAAIKDARAKRESGAITPAQLKEIEDREIEKIVRKQQEIGLKLATDGEYRRSWWHFDFLEKLDGVEGFSPEHGIQFHGVETKPKAVRVVGKIRFSGHPMLEHFKFLQAHARVQPKMTIPSPSVLHFRSGRAGISKQIYPDIEGFFDDLAEAYRKAVRAFADAGCRYLQLDDTVWAYLCSAEQREEARARGDDPARLPAIYARVINHAIAGRPSDMMVTTH